MSHDHRIPSCFAAFAIICLLLVMAIPSTVFALVDEKPLTFKDISQMRLKRKSHDEIVEAAKARGVAFKVDDATAKRLGRMKFSDDQVDLLRRINEDPEAVRNEGKATEEGDILVEEGKDIFEVPPNVPLGPRKPKAWQENEDRLATEIAKSTGAPFFKNQTKHFTLWATANTTKMHLGDLKTLEAMVAKRFGGLYEKGTNPLSAHIVLCDDAYTYKKYIEGLFAIYARNGRRFGGGGGMDPKEMALKSAAFTTTVISVVDLSRVLPGERSKRQVAYAAGQFYMRHITEGRCSDGLSCGFANVCEAMMYQTPGVTTQSYEMRDLGKGNQWSDDVAALIKEDRLDPPGTVLKKYDTDIMKLNEHQTAWSLVNVLTQGPKQFEAMTKAVRDGAAPLDAVETNYKLDEKTLYKKWIGFAGK